MHQIRTKLSIHLFVNSASLLQFLLNYWKTFAINFVDDNEGQATKII